MLTRKSILLICQVCLTFLIIFPLSPKTSLSQDLNQKSIQIYFNSDDYELNPAAKNFIRESILTIGSMRIREIYVAGHTDSDASDEYNQVLSSKRAEYTKEFLKDQGVREKMIHMEYFGESMPKSDIKSQNRRVEITFVYELDSEQNLSTSNPEKHVLKFNTYNSATREKLPCSFSIEINGQNQHGVTDINGKYVTRKFQKGAAVVFSREGFLNETVQIEKFISSSLGDTIYIDAYLKPVNVVQKLRFDHIYFYTDSDILKPESEPELENLLKVLQEYPDLYVEIQGHMNFPSSRRCSPFQKIYNLDLSYRRAKAVYNYLIKNGISNSRLTYKGLSNFQMVYPEPKNREQEDMNKRVEVWTLKVAEDQQN
ncbi:MAG: OmpA family protein [Bacteroidetes bacterium]|nr:OmpA family protein [Bacteroidota bacterium]